MIAGWILFIIFILIIIWLTRRSCWCSEEDAAPPEETSALSRTDNVATPAKVSLEEAATLEYGVEYSFPTASEELLSYGIPKSTIEKNSDIIQANIDMINNLNKRSLSEKLGDPLSTPPRFGITIATAYTDEEFRKGYFGLNIPQDKKFGVGNNLMLTPSNGKKINIPSSFQIPETVNPKGSLKLPVYDQQQCGCCWVVSSSNVLNHKLNEQKDITFPNQYVYCLPNSPELSTYSKGCQGGIPSDVFLTVLDTKNVETMINTDSNLIFNQNLSSCGRAPTQYGLSNKQLVISGIVGLYYEDTNLSVPSFQYFSLDQIRKLSVQTQNGKTFGLFNYQMTDLRIPTSQQISTIKYLLNTIGPMVIGINADVPEFKSYRSGNLSLSSGNPDHAVLLYGYGKNNGEEVWFVQNSWGISKWGENGFVNARISNSYITLITGIVSEKDKESLRL
jgi:C1A family cysteine protease